MYCWKGHRSGRPECAEVDSRIARLPAAEETLNRWVQHDGVQLARPEEAMAADGCIPRGHCLERPPAEIPGEDDVDHVLGREAPGRRDRVHDRHRPFYGQLIVDPDLLGQLAVQRVDEALPGVDAAPWQEPVLLAGLLVSAQQNAAFPAQDRGHADSGLDRDHVADDPKPRTPRSLP